MLHKVYLNMNVYDFDQTIYKGDSTLDFYFFCMKRHPKILISLPCQIKGIFLYGLKKIDKTRFKELFFSFLKYVPKIDIEIEKFWDVKCRRICAWYINQKKKNDLIISASPEFLLAIICKRMQVYNLIASQVDKYTGCFMEENCFGERKLENFLKHYPDGCIDEFYSDSTSDEPLAKISKHPFLVVHYRPVKWPL